MTTEDEFWAHVAVPDGADPDVIKACWPWQAGKNAEGYGVLKFGKRVVYAHHMAHDSVHGPAPNVAAASSTVRSSPSSTGCTARTTKGKVTKSNANTMPGGAKMMRQPSVCSSQAPMGCCGP